MSRKILGFTAASLAMAAGLGTATLAQDAAPAAPTGDLPAVLQALNLQNVEIRQGPRGGRKVEGDLSGGGEIEAFLDDQGNLVMVDTDDVAMPQSVLDAMLPPAVRDSGMLAQFAVIEKIGGRDGRVMVGGEDADGEDLRAAFDADGRLMRFGRGDDDEGRRGRHEGGHGMKGGDRHGDGRGGMRGKDGHGRGGPGMDDHGKGRRGEGGPGKGPMDGPRGADGRPGGMSPGPVDTAALSSALEAAGYSAVGDARPAGPRLLVEATNPAGEAVTLEVDPAGEVLRETAR